MSEKKYIDANEIIYRLKIAIGMTESKITIGYLEYLISLIEQAPVADVQEVKHAKWIEDAYYNEEIVCSNCGTPAIIDANMQIAESFYCPWCGAKTDGGKE